MTNDLLLSKSAQRSDWFIVCFRLQDDD